MDDLDRTWTRHALKKRTRPLRNRSKPLNDQDWLAYIPMGAGGTWARGKDRAGTIRRCLRLCRSDWGSLYRLDGEEVDMLVADVSGHDHVRFDSSGIWTEPESSDGNSPSARTYLDKSLVEVVKHTFPGKKR